MEIWPVRSAIAGMPRLSNASRLRICICSRQQMCACLSGLWLASYSLAGTTWHDKICESNLTPAFLIACGHMIIAVFRSGTACDSQVATNVGQLLQLVTDKPNIYSKFHSRKPQPD